MNEDLNFENFSEAHAGFLRSLEKFPDEPLPGLEMRGYQMAGIRKVRDDILAGHQKGQFILGTGGGKTTISKALIAGTEGRTLYLGPSRASAQQGEKEFKKRGLTKSYQVLDEDTPFAKFDPKVDLTYATAQMFTHGRRYETLSPDQFDMVIFDEAHHFLGQEFSKLSEYFNAAQLFMTATPGNMRSHLKSLAPHQFFKYSSEDLIDNENFPHWRVFRHEVSGEHLENAVMIGDHMHLEGVEGSVLNLPHRFAICRDLFLESVAKGEKRISFMPSVGSSKKFVNEIISAYPLLVGKVVHVDGDTKNLREIKSAFERGEILGICCKDLWTESLDVPDIAAITLADPSCSERVIMQRIGRGARPSPGKTFLRIDDVVSCISNMTYGKDSTTAKRPLTVHGVLGLKKYVLGEAVNGPTVYKDETKYETTEISFTERHLSQDIAFIRNPELGAALFKEFARIFGTSVINLLTKPAIFYKNKKPVTIETHDGETFEIDFEDAHKAALLFGCIRRIEDEIVRGVETVRRKVKSGVNDVIEDIDKVKSPFRKELDFDLLDWHTEMPPLLPISEEKQELFAAIWKDLIANLKKGKMGERETLDYFLTYEKFISMARNGNQRKLITLGNCPKLLEEFRSLVKANTDYDIDMGKIESDEPSLRFYGPYPKKENCDITEYLEGAKKARFLDRFLRSTFAGANYVKHRKIMEVIRENGMVISPPYLDDIYLYPEMNDKDFEKTLNEVIMAAKRQEISISYEKVPDGEYDIEYRLTMVFNQERVEVNALAFEKIRMLQSLDLEDKELNRVWQRIIKQVPLDQILAEGFYEKIDLDLGQKPLFIGGGGPIISYQWFLGDKKEYMFPTIRRLEAALRKRGIVIKMEFAPFVAMIKKFDVSEIDNNPNPDVENQSPWETSLNSIRPIFLTNEVITTYNSDTKQVEKKMAAYETTLKTVKLMLSKLKEGDEFQIPANEIDPEILKKIIGELTGNIGPGDWDIKFELVGDLYKFKVNFPSDEVMQKWQKGRLQFEGIRKIKFSGLQQNLLWQKLIEEFAHAIRFDDQAYCDFDSYVDGSAFYTMIDINPENTSMVQDMAKQLAEYGVKFDYLEDEREKGKYWFPICINRIKVDLPDVNTSIVLAEEKAKNDSADVDHMNSIVFASGRNKKKFFIADSDIRLKDPAAEAAKST